VHFTHSHKHVLANYNAFPDFPAQNKHGTPSLLAISPWPDKGLLCPLSETESFPLGLLASGASESKVDARKSPWAAKEHFALEKPWIFAGRMPTGVEGM
jgi:hypothetical protein